VGEAVEAARIAHFGPSVCHDVHCGGLLRVVVLMP
jgi:hypothetical protein